MTGKPLEIGGIQGRKEATGRGVVSCMVEAKLIEIMQRAFKEVHGTALEKNVDLRTAALMLGIGRIAEAKRRRGVFP